MMCRGRGNEENIAKLDLTCSRKLSINQLEHGLYIHVLASKQLYRQVISSGFLARLYHGLAMRFFHRHGSLNRCRVVQYTLVEHARNRQSGD